MKKRASSREEEGNSKMAQKIHGRRIVIKGRRERRDRYSTTDGQRRRRETREQGKEPKEGNVLRSQDMSKEEV